MKELIFILLLTFLISVSFSSIGNSTYNLLTNCTIAANKDIDNYHTWVDCLNRTSFVLNGSYSYGSKGILFLRGYSKYNFEIYNGTKKIYSNLTKQIVYLLPNGNYTLKISSTGYVTDNLKIKLNPGEFKFYYFELQKNSTTKNKTSTSNNGLISNTFVDLSNTYIKEELKDLKDTLGLSDENISYQEKVLDYTKVHVKYYLFVNQNANTLYYYVYNNWNKTINVTIVVEIPKEISQNLDGVSLKSGYKLIKSDPIVSWNLNIMSGKSAYVEYTVTNKNITTITPPVLLFSGIELPKSINKTINQTTVQNQTINLTSENNQTQPINETNSTKKIGNHKGFNILTWILAIILISLGILTLYFYLFRKKPHQLIEKSLDKIERFIG